MRFLMSWVWQLFFVEKVLNEGGHICVQPYQKFSENFQHYWKLVSDADASVGILSTLPEMDNKNTGKFRLCCLDSLEVWKTAPWKENFSALRNAVGVIVSVSKDSVQVTCRADNTTVIQDECKKKRFLCLNMVILTHFCVPVFSCDQVCHICIDPSHHHQITTAQH